MNDTLVLILLVILILLLLPLMIRIASMSFAVMLGLGLMVLLGLFVFSFLGITLPPGLFVRTELIIICCVLAIGIVLNVAGSGNATAKKVGIIYMLVALLTIAGIGLFRIYPLL